MLISPVVVTKICAVVEVLPGMGTANHPCRASHGLVYYKSGSTAYTFGETAFKPAAGSLIYLPKGSCYRAIGHDSDCIAVNFDADTPLSDAPFVLNAARIPCAELFEDCLKAWTKRTQPDYSARTMSLLYALLDRIAEARPAYLDSRRTQALQRAAEWIETHLTDEDMTVGRLAEIAGMSEVYFRRLFHACYGVPPVKYINALRLNRARDLLSAQACTVEQAALLAGFHDKRYFYRAWRARYGTPPGKLND